jgi:hypothetical protein
VTMI